ncbi:MAG: YHS domain-containing (seleno)protein [Devosia sp.]
MRKQILTIAALLLMVAPGQAESLVSAIVTDPITGVAIDGYDPVSYFIGVEPQQGKPDYEYYWGGVPWYFANAANRDVFIRSPQAYAPQFGGYCLMSLSRGYLSEGKPRLYVIDALKLYFFYSSANREAFLLSRAAPIELAAANWPELSSELSGAGSQTPVSAAMAEAPAAPDTAFVAPAAATATLQSN